VLNLRLNLRILNPIAILAVAALLANVATATTTPTKSTKSTSASSSSHKSSKSSKSSKSAKTSTTKSKKKSAKATHGQHTIDQERTVEIQQALVREHYLPGEPSGKWDQSTKDAFVRLQAENGWQTKVTPDSRALIKLGLGPDKKGLLNPDTAVMSSPHELGTQHDTVPGGSSQQ
jgi:cytoskeletal protein RodZ